MLRRDFLRRSARTLGAAWLTTSPVARAALIDPDPLPESSMLRMRLWWCSNQTRLGTSPLSTSPSTANHENGPRFFDSADPYGSPSL